MIDIGLAEARDYRTQFDWSSSRLELSRFAVVSDGASGVVHKIVLDGEDRYALHVEAFLPFDLRPPKSKGK